ncbi:MAG: aspartate carbamoyltransferase catalytic subunit [Planctomycetota bacterium]|nr:aspartate carbamoyltransferase catalytic subunit [Planctomycetota bacterium]
MPVPVKRDLISIDDLSCAEILELFEHADAFREDLNGWSHVCRGLILAALFFEPSTRTRLSFESAMLRLGGGVITVPEGQSSSSAKGETLADTVRVVGGSYADLLVVRHPRDGSARVAGRYAQVPVINGGDGAHEHPTQTLCDLYTLWRERGRLQGLDVVLCGDLRYSRTIHSFAYALGRFGANIITIPYPGFEMPQYVLERLNREFGVKATSASMGDLQDIVGAEDTAAAAYLTASRPHQQALFTELTERHIDRIDAIYMTRAQRERHGSGQAAEGYPRLSGDNLRSDMFRDTRVMHPLPRLDEIDPSLDGDPRAVYFRQAELGVPIRMALMAFLLGKIQLQSKAPLQSSNPVYLSSVGGFRCRNERCITAGEGRRYLSPEFVVLKDEQPLLTCVYCGKDARPGVIGDQVNQVYGLPASAWAGALAQGDIVYFATEEQARVAGFLPEKPA